MKTILCLFLLSVMASLAGPPPPILTIAPAASGQVQIIAATGALPAATFCVLQSTTNFVVWTSIATNQLPYNGVATNIVQITNPQTFYRAYNQYGIN